jgi:hypothetical protein
MTIYVTAAIVRTVLLFIDPVQTPKIAYDKDELAQPLIDHLKEAVGDKDGSIKVRLVFKDDYDELLRQFYGVCNNIKIIFTILDKSDES